MVSLNKAVLDPTDDTGRRILDAVREEVLAFGVRRSTMTSIANRAQVSRVTLYRRGTELNSLIMEALVREFQELLVTSIPDDEPRCGREIVVNLCVGAVSALAQAPLFASLRKHDPDMLLPYLVQRFGRNQQIMLAALQPAISIGISDGSIRDQDPKVLAEVLLQSLTLLSVGTQLEYLDDEAMRREIAHLVSGYLEPKE